MADSKTSSASSSTSSSASKSAVAQPVQKYMLSAEDCAELFSTVEPIGSLDAYLINRCGNNESVKIPASSMSSDGIQISFAYEGDILQSASPSNDYYRMTNATVNVSFTLRLATIANAIRQLILPGTISEVTASSSSSNTAAAASGYTPPETKQTVSRSILRRRPNSLVLVMVAEGETPNPETALGGGFVFPNTTIDYSNTLDLSYGPVDPVEVPVNLVSRFTRGVSGVLAEMYY